MKQSKHEKSNDRAMRQTFITYTPKYLLPISLERAASVHENATPIEIISPKRAFEGMYSAIILCLLYILTRKISDSCLIGQMYFNI